MADYEAAVMDGQLTVAAYLREINVFQKLRIKDFRYVDHLIFGGVHPWAGEFRVSGQMATIAGYPAAEPQRIELELAMALFQSVELMTEAAHEEDGFGWLAALAFQHVRFERIHPFLDGNGRVGRSILTAQFATLFERRPLFQDQPAYRAALRAAAGKDLAPLMNDLGITAGLSPAPSPWLPRFRLAPRFIAESASGISFLDEIAWSRELTET